MATRDIVVIGASSGGVPLLLELVPDLPRELPAAIFVVLHTAAHHLSPLPGLLSARGALPAVHPVHGEAIEPGKIYVAPGDAHLQVRPGYVEVVRGPKENGHRPAVDALFRTAARAYGPRVIGVVLSGHQDCGTAGMLSIKARGGVSVVQDPRTAVAPSMPESVLERAPVDHVVQPLELAGLLARLVREPAPAAPTSPSALEAFEGQARGAPNGDIVCPHCQGALTEAAAGGFERFRCHEGHAFSLRSLALHQAEEVERALWAAARALEEAAGLSRRLSLTSSPGLRERFAEREQEQRRQAELLRRVILDGDDGPRREVTPQPDA